MLIHVSGNLFLLPPRRPVVIMLSPDSRSRIRALLEYPKARTVLKILVTTIQELETADSNMFPLVFTTASVGQQYIFVLFFNPRILARTVGAVACGACRSAVGQTRCTGQAIDWKP